jgi:hypothetical protein
MVTYNTLQCTIRLKTLNASHILSWVKGKVKSFLCLIKRSTMRAHGGLKYNSMHS